MVLVSSFGSSKCLSPRKAFLPFDMWGLPAVAVPCNTPVCDRSALQES